MTFINVGAAANDGDGDPLRGAFEKVNGWYASAEPHFGIIHTMRSGGLMGVSSLHTDNRGVYHRVGYGGTITKIGVHPWDAAGNICAAVYANTGSGRAATPGTLKGSSASVAATAGFMELSLGGSVTLDPSDWFYLAASSAACTFASFSAAGLASPLFAGLSYFQDNAFPAPTTPSPVAGFIAGPRLVASPNDLIGEP